MLEKMSKTKTKGIATRFERPNDITVKVKAKTLLREHIKTIIDATNKGVISTKKEVKRVQDEMIDLLDASSLEGGLKSKFIKRIARVHTKEQLSKRINQD